MADHLTKTFAQAKAENRPAFVAYVTAGYPESDDTVSILLALERGGADIIELGIPFSDPIADGPTIQAASHTALQHGTDLKKCFEYVEEARNAGLKTPVVFMGYWNPFLMYGEEKLVADCSRVGVNGFIVVDLPPEEALRFRDICGQKGLSYIPLIAPSTSLHRIQHLASCASSFIYVLSVMGVTGARTEVNTALPDIVGRIRQFTDLPLAVGFGVSTREHFVTVAKEAEGVVIGSQIIKIVSAADKADRAKKIEEYACCVSGRSRADTDKSKLARVKHNENGISAAHRSALPYPGHLLSDRFGSFGGQYAPEALIDCLDEIEKAFVEAKQDPAFWREFEEYYSYMGRPSPLHMAERLTEECGGARIWFKREDLNHTGSHKINNALGQVMLARRLGKSRIIAETGAGQHGVATATACAKFGMHCTIYMGAEDVQRQALNVFRMKLLGATVVPVDSGSRTLKDAINEAMRDWVTNVSTTHYVIGSAIGPHPFPTIVREFQSVIGTEARAQMIQKARKLPDVVLACVGGGSNAIGTFHPFVNDSSVRLIGCEAGGEGIESGAHSATLCAGKPGVLHGTRTYLLQSEHGQIQGTHSISAGLDYPGVGPEHAYLKEIGRAEYVAVTDEQSLIGLRLACEKEGILPALETAHAIYYATVLARTLRKDQDVLVCISGRGDKDVVSIAKALPRYGKGMDWNVRFEGDLEIMGMGKEGNLKEWRQEEQHEHSA